MKKSSNRNLSYFVMIILITLLITNPQNLKSQVFSELGISFDDYKSQISEWDINRVKRLKAVDGWINLSGLLWLSEGKSKIGSDKNNEIFITSETNPNAIMPYAADLHFSNGVVWLKNIIDKNIKVNGKFQKEILLFHKDSVENPMVECNNLRWTIIKRDNDYAVRLRDLDNKLLSSFKGIKRYEIDTNYIVRAKFIPHVSKDKISITKMNGKVSELSSSGKLEFVLNNKKMSIDVLDEGDQFFLIFGDNTNENETYPSGRFMYVNRPVLNNRTHKSNEVIIDFNYAYNPPCAFTDFANCPLPPIQNILPIEIKAGEKYSHSK